MKPQIGGSAVCVKCDMIQEYLRLSYAAAKNVADAMREKFGDDDEVSDAIASSREIDLDIVEEILAK